MPSPEGPVRPSRASLRRPNGRPQACEPCRRRKVACDNAQPVCRRCEKAGRAANCLYIVDPRMSIVTPTTQAAANTPASLASRRPSPSQQLGAVHHPSVSSTAFSSVTNSPRSNPVTGPGYLGPTSFCDIYEEAEERLALLKETCQNARDHPGAHIATSDLPRLSPRTLETCLAVLRQIPRRSDAERLCSSVNVGPNEMWYWLIGFRALASLYDTFDQYLGDGKRTDAGLGEMAKRLCFNTSQPFPENEEDLRSWERHFSGINYRWETLGILFTYWGFGTNVSTPVRCEITQASKLRVCVNDYHEAIDICIQLCRTLNNGSTFLLFIIYRRTFLESMKSGDASPLVWRGQGDVVSHLTFLGLHAERESPYVPTICSEWRRRLCYYVFNIDKVIAAFTGRPPAFGRRYLQTPPPLDLPDEDLKADRPTLARAAATKLDADGWNLSGEVGAATILRARAVIAMFREEILEISIGNGADTTAEDLWEIMNRMAAAVAALPPGLLYRHEELIDPSVDMDIFSYRLLLRLEHLQNSFFIYRLLKPRGYDSQADLIAVSFELLSLSLIFWTHLVRVPRIVTYLEWIVMAYAAPAGGILSQELLCHSSTPGRTANSGPDGPSRFAIIEKLFLLMGFLDWVSPNAPNSDLCRSCKRVIHHVLERVTAHEPPLVPGVEQRDPAFEPWNWDLGGTSLDFDFELLDTFDWLRPEVQASQG